MLISNLHDTTKVNGNESCVQPKNEQVFFSP